MFAGAAQWLAHLGAPRLQPVVNAFKYDSTANTLTPVTAGGVALTTAAIPTQVGGFKCAAGTLLLGVPAAAIRCKSASRSDGPHGCRVDGV